MTSQCNNRPGNLVLVVELLFLFGKSNFSFNEAVRLGVSDKYSSSGNSVMLIVSQNYCSNQEPGFIICNSIIRISQCYM